MKAHCTKKDKAKMTQLEMFVTEGNENADDLAKTGAMLDEGFMVEEQCSRKKRRCIWLCSMWPASTAW